MAAGDDAFADTRQASPGELADAGRALADGLIVADRYTILRFLARGGMGEVYEAHDRVLDIAVALKTIRADAQNPQTIERLRREVRSPAR